jgi:tripartite-type tricarboxylate transporter receptor subunit TctC
MLEAGFPNSEYVFWIGAFAPAATQRDIVQRLHDAITKALADPEVQSGIKKLAAEPMPLMPEKFDDFIKRESRNQCCAGKSGGHHAELRMPGWP